MKTTLEKALEVIKRIEHAGFKALLVGGCVRDSLLGVEPKDFDIATDAGESFLVGALGAKEVGKSFGVFLVEIDGESFEIARFRTDSASASDGRHPDSVKFVESFKEDSFRRDFTINALGMGLHGIEDWVGGMADIKSKLVRAVGDPRKRFTEDKLRILRGIRFAAVLDFTIEEETAKTMKDMGSACVEVSPERIRMELFKVASAGGPATARFITILKDLDLLVHVLPEIDVMSSCEHTIESHPEGNVFVHTICALEVCRSMDPVVVLGVLFHDIGKPPIKFYNEEGRVRYTGHDDSQFFLPVADRLKFSSEETRRICHFIDLHMVSFDIPVLKKSKAMAIVDSPHWKDLFEVIWADSNCNIARSIPVSPRVARQLADIESRASELLENKEPEKVTKIKKLINGNWVMEVMGVKGQMVGFFKEKGIDFAIDTNLDPDDPEKTLDEVRAHLQAERICSLGSLFPK
jgi:poly(A) polymerase